jgi:hypothetical protein
MSLVKTVAPISIDNLNKRLITEDTMIEILKSKVIYKSIYKFYNNYIDN